LVTTSKRGLFLPSMGKKKLMPASVRNLGGKGSS
jgi:hypothetical protein